MPAKNGQHALLVRPAQRADPQLGLFSLPRALGRVLVYLDRSGMAVFPCRQDCRPDEGMVSLYVQVTTANKRHPDAGGVGRTGRFILGRLDDLPVGTNAGLHGWRSMARTPARGPGC